MNKTTETNAYNNVEFCHGIDANILKDTTKILPWDAVKDKIIKQNPDNNLYEVTKPNKNIKIFIDIDGEANENMTKSKFYVIVNSIMNQLSLLDCGVMNSSKYEHTYMDNDSKEITKHKYSFRLTFHKYISCISKMVAIIENEYYPMLKNELKDIIDVDFGNKTEDSLNIDKSVYRSKGVGKMRSPNAYKGKTVNFKNSHYNSFEFDRPNHIVKGSIEDNLIHYIDPTDEFIDIKEEPKKEPKNSIINVVKTNMTNDMTNVSEVEALLNLIDVQYLLNYSDWTKIIWAGKSCGVDEDFLREISKKVIAIDEEKYSDKGFDDTWNAYSSPTNGIGTIKYYAKLSNKDKYYEISSYNDMTTDDDITISTIDSCEISTDMTIKESYMKSLIENRTDDDFAKIICENMKDDLVLNEKDDKLYIHYKNFWTNNENLICNRISKIITSLCLSYKKNLENIKFEYGDPNYKTNLQKIKDIQKTINDIGKASKRESIIKIMKHNMATEMKNIKFDTYTPHIFCFNNIAFNLHTGEVYEPKKTDYITMKSGYDYIEPTQDDINEIDKLFDSIFPDPEVKKTYISILRTGLSGKRHEKLFMANGVGRNGKGVLNELMMACVGNYGHKMNISVLVDKIKDGPNTSVNNLNMKRFVVTNEPNDNENILCGNIKRITGDMIIPARGLYSSSEDTTLNLSLVLELNKMINIKGRIDHAMISRLVSIRFGNIFTNDPDILKNNPNAYPENPKLKDPEFQNKYRHAMFKYLLNSPDELYICEACKQETMEYFKNQNEMYNWFIENYRKTDVENSYISIKDIYNHWKESDLYSNMTKNEKRANSMKKFKQTQILENNEMRPYYIEDTERMVDGKKIRVKNCLFGWELIPPECMIDMEDE